MKKYPNIEVQLSGEDGNALVVMCRVLKAMRRANVPNEEIEQFTNECTSGDYDHLLQTCMKWVNIS